MGRNRRAMAARRRCRFSMRIFLAAAPMDRAPNIVARLMVPMPIPYMASVLFMAVLKITGPPTTKNGVRTRFSREARIMERSMRGFRPT